jgi:hypothetical protein
MPYDSFMKLADDRVIMSPMRKRKEILLCLLAAWPSWSAQLSTEAKVADHPTPSAAVIAARQAPAVARYDSDYPVIGYSSEPTHNAVARLQARLDRGEATLKFNGTRGYLDALLQALGVDPSSQMLVYSKTSLQTAGIRAATPRAIYFNDETYVAWVQGAELLEVVALDSALGPVFYTLANRDARAQDLQRETLRCLGCHDKFSLTGGGVPIFMVHSSLVSTGGHALTRTISIEVTDRTPIEQRWGGWYVTGQHAEQTHLGNILAVNAKQIENLDKARRGTLVTLAELFDTRPYLTDKSDIVALLVFEHQTSVQNLIIRVNYKARSFLAKESNGGAWDKASTATQSKLKKLTEPLVEAMLFVGAAPITGRISGNAGYEAWFQAQGPRDPSGRSLRALNLKNRLFQYPLSYLIYSDGFEGLPDDAKKYVYSRIADILSGRDASKQYAHLSVGDRKVLMEILTATKPAFAAVAASKR